MSSDDAAPTGLLTPRQIEVLELMSKGLTNREIARVLSISPATVKHHVSAVIDGLGVSNRTEAVGSLRELGRSEASEAESDSPYRVPGFGRRPAIAVLPFDNLSGEADQEAFVDGLVEDLTTRLATWRWFPVIARNSVFAWKGRGVDVKEVSRELGARYLLEGSSRRAGARVRVNVQLVEGPTGAHLWAERYDREARDLFAVQDEIVEAVIRALAPALSGVERLRALRRPVADLDAWESMQRGLYFLERSHKGDFEAAGPFLRRATEIDPLLGPGWCGVARWRLAGVMLAAFPDPAQALLEAVDCGRRASELDPLDAAGHAAHGSALALLRRQPEAAAALQRAVELDPSSAYAAFALGACLVGPGAAEQATEHLARAIRLSPRDPMLHISEGTLALALTFLGRHEEALVHVRRSRQVQPGYGFSFWALEAAILGHLGRIEEALRVRDAILARNPQFSRQVANLLAHPAVVAHMDAGFEKAGWKPF